MLERLHVIICLFAAIVMCIAGFIQKITLQQMTLRLILTIIAFFIIGVIVRHYLANTIFKEVDVPEEVLEMLEDDESIIAQDNEDEANFQNDTENDEDEIYH